MLCSFSIWQYTLLKYVLFISYSCIFESPFAVALSLFLRQDNGLLVFSFTHIHTHTNTTSGTVHLCTSTYTRAHSTSFPLTIYMTHMSVDPADTEFEEWLEQEDIPEKFECGMTYGLMTDPVYAKDSQRDDGGAGLVNYERSALKRWLSERHTNPLTREGMSVGDIVANSKLKEEITAWRKEKKAEYDDREKDQGKDNKRQAAQMINSMSQDELQPLAKTKRSE